MACNFANVANKEFDSTLYRDTDVGRVCEQ